MDLIEDQDGAPLPVELQRDTALYAAVRTIMANEILEPGDLEQRACDLVMIALAPHLWPWLPSNDHGTTAGLADLIKVACYDPGRFTHRAESYTEELWHWQARAVQIVVSDPARALAAL